MTSLRSKLTNRLPKERAYGGTGISSTDLEQLILTEDLKADILESIRSEDMADVRIAFFFAENIPAINTNAQFQQCLVSEALQLLSRSEWGIKQGCFEILGRYGRQIKSYRELMLGALADIDPEVRRVALRYYKTYAHDSEIEPLEPFEKDSYLTEIGMGSHLIYDLRNQALEIIESVIGKVFTKSEKTEVIKDGNVAFWWDWKPFHEWKNSWLNKLFRG